MGFSDSWMSKEKFRMDVKYVVCSENPNSDEHLTEVYLENGFIILKDFDKENKFLSDFTMKNDRARLIAQAILKLTETV